MPVPATAGITRHARVLRAREHPEWPRQHPSKVVSGGVPGVDLASNTKKAMIDLCNARLAEGLDLALLTKQAHWNIKGPTFIAVHLLLDDLRNELDEHTDTIAERVAQLDGIAWARSRRSRKHTSLPPYPTDIRKIPDHLRRWSSATPASPSGARKGIDAPTKPATPTRPTSSPPIRARSTRRCGS